MSTYWDSFINLYSSLLPDMTMRQILIAFCDYVTGKDKECDKYIHDLFREKKEDSEET